MGIKEFASSKAYEPGLGEEPKSADELEAAKKAAGVISKDEQKSKKIEKHKNTNELYTDEDYVVPAGIEEGLADNSLFKRTNLKEALDEYRDMSGSQLIREFRKEKDPMARQEIMLAYTCQPDSQTDQLLDWYAQLDDEKDSQLKDAAMRLSVFSNGLMVNPDKNRTDAVHILSKKFRQMSLDMKSKKDYSVIGKALIERAKGLKILDNKYLENIKSSEFIENILNKTTEIIRIDLKEDWYPASFYLENKIDEIKILAGSVFIDDMSIWDEIHKIKKF